MSAGYLLFLGIGRLLIFIGVKFVQINEIKIPFLQKLASCLLCSGTWVYTLLSFLAGYIILEEWAVVPILSQIITGCFSAYLVYLVESGWKSMYEVIII